MVIYLSTPGGMTGAPRRMLTLCDAVAPYGVDPAIVADEDTQLFSEAKRLSIETVSLRTAEVLKERNRGLLRGGVFKRLWIFANLIWHNLSFFLVLRKARPDVLVFRASKTFAFAGVGALLLRKPIVWDVDFETPSKGVVGGLQAFALRVSKIALLQYPGAQNRIFDERTSKGSASKFCALIPGIRLAALDDHVISRRSRAHSQGQPYRILHVGTICDRKNQLLTLRVLVEIQNRYASLLAGRRLVVSLAGGVHEADYMAMLKAYVDRNRIGDHVEFLGWHDNVPALMAESDLLVLPSKDEGVPNTVQEAMYIGCPVAVANAGGMPSIVEHGKSGWVLPVDDPVPWADLIAGLLGGTTNPAPIVGYAHDVAVRSFDDQKWAQLYAEALARVAQGR